MIVSVTPEDMPPINCSAWYAFRITSRAGATSPRTISVQLEYEACGHRYRPKVSVNGQDWSLLPNNAVSVSDDRATATMEVPVGDLPVIVSAQEILPVATYGLWLDRLEALPHVRRFRVGTSAEGRAIEGAAIGNRDAKRLVLVLGRQHPPEVTGALALIPFVETLAANEPTAVRYREEVLTVVVPLINPDGVSKGYWRHNVNGIDLNRDWGPFTQPETRAVRDTLEQYVAQGARLEILIDFHSTGRDVFYTLPDELETNPPLLAQEWLDRLEARLPGFKVNRAPGHNPDRFVSKAYAYERFGAAGVTFELGDRTDRSVIVEVGQHAALALMEEMIEHAESD